jgi:hypothetical protein
VRNRSAKGLEWLRLLLLFHLGGTLSDEDLVAELLVTFELEAPGNVAAVDENLSGHSAVVTVSSEHMR